MAVGFIVFVMAAVGLVTAFPAGPTAVVGLGVFFVGMGEWISHPLETSIYVGDGRMPPGVATRYPRRWKPLGVMFDLMGLALIGLGVYGLRQIVTT